MPSIRSRLYDRITIPPLRRLLYPLSRRPVVVMGNQKSGTSAIAHLLADACGLSKTIDVPQVWPPSFCQIVSGRRSLSSIVEMHPRPFSRDLIKEPYLTFHYPELRKIFPDGPWVYVVRDPRDNIRSLLDRLSLPGDQPENPEGVNDLPQGWAPTFDPKIWGSESDHYIEVLAARWNLAADVYLDHPDSFALVRYEDFDADKAPTIYRLAERLGRSVIRGIEDRVDVQFQPAGNRTVSWGEFFGRRNQERIERRCVDRMRRFGYSLQVAMSDRND